MNFHDYVKSLEDDVASFKNGYEQKSREFPDMHPMDMRAGDWFEQFLLWNDDDSA